MEGCTPTKKNNLTDQNQPNWHETSTGQIVFAIWKTILRNHQYWLDFLKYITSNLFQVLSSFPFFSPHFLYLFFSLSLFSLYLILSQHYLSTHLTSSMQLYFVHLLILMLFISISIDSQDDSTRSIFINFIKHFKTANLNLTKIDRSVFGVSLSNWLSSLGLEKTIVWAIPNKAINKISGENEHQQRWLSRASECAS